MISTARIFGAVLALTILLGQPAPAALAQAAPYCAPGTQPQFTHGFAALKAALGPVMGEPTECEHNDGDSGDILQQTTTGLSFWRKSTNTPTFTDGYRHWALLPAGAGRLGRQLDRSSLNGARRRATIRSAAEHRHPWRRQQRPDRGSGGTVDHGRTPADPERVRLPHHGPGAVW